jgi:hyaluronan synthase
MAAFDAVSIPAWIIPFGVFGALSWGIWLLRRILSAMTSPTVNEFETSTTVIVPSFREDPAVLMRCLATWRAQRPDRIVIVLDLADTEAERLIHELDDPSVEAMMFKHTGKRSALSAGIRTVDTELTVLVDSDTAWEADMLAHIQMPFADPAVGAVSTRQNVYMPNSSIWRRVADWIIDLRYCDYAPAMGRYGGVICASGRTAAYRTSVIADQLDALENETFRGRKCVAGDDGRLTWLVLSRGYRVAHQDSARALSMFPDTFRAFVKQRVRWSRNSYRCYLTAIKNRWIFNVPFISQLTVMQILFTPVSMAVAITYMWLSLNAAHPFLALFLAISWVVIGRGIRSLSHLRRRPRDIWLLPLVTAVVVCIALPIKVYALFTMNKQGWLTRSEDSIGGEGQREETLSSQAGPARG